MGVVIPWHERLYIKDIKQNMDNRHDKSINGMFIVEFNTFNITILSPI